MSWFLGGIAFLFLVLRFLGRRFVKFVVFFVVVGVFLSVRRRQPFRLMLNFAWSLVDKAAACAGYGRPPSFVFTGDDQWMRGGCFLISTQVGCSEVLPAAVDPASAQVLRVHAFQQLSHNSIFTREFLRHLDPRRLTLHAVEDLGVETAVEMQENIRRGEIVLMAGDRQPAGGGRKGVFRFAKLMVAPIYAIACVSIGHDRYEVRARVLGPEVEREYESFLSELVREFPNQHYEFA